MMASTDVDSFRAAYRLVSGSAADLERAKPYLVGYKAHAFGFTGLVRAENLSRCDGLQTAPADLESIMIYTEQEDDHETASL